MKDKDNLDIKLMFDQACAFLDCAEYTESEKYKIKNRTYSHGYVDISLSALACEIFIKCLIIEKHGRYGKEHSLKKLWEIYKQLDENKSADVEKWMQDWFKSDDSEMFNKMISDAAFSFSRWRYVFDYESSDGIRINSQFLRGFRTVLREITCQTIHGKSWETIENELV